MSSNKGVRVSCPGLFYLSATSNIQGILGTIFVQREAILSKEPFEEMDGHKGKHAYRSFLLLIDDDDDKNSRHLQQLIAIS